MNNLIHSVLQRGVQRSTGKEDMMLLIPYKSFRFTTKLTSKQCLEKLTSVVQPENRVPLVSTADSLDSRIIFKGEIKRDKFYLRYIDRSRSPSRRSNSNLVVTSGRLRNVNGGSEIEVVASLDPLYAVWISFLSLALGFIGLYAAYTVLNNPHSTHVEKMYVAASGILVFLWYLFAHYALFTYIFAKSAAKSCEAFKQIFDSPA